MAEKKVTINENYRHICKSELVSIADSVSIVANTEYTSDEIRKIIEFYLLNAPILKADKTENNGLKNLQDYGWKGNADMMRLEKELLRTAGMQSFCFIRANKIDETLRAMFLGESQYCIEHPRAVLKQEYKIDVSESEDVKLTNKETRMECLFRHIRNSFAHNGIYTFKNSSILLEDKDGNMITARILLKKETLLKWIDVIKKENANLQEVEMNEPKESLKKNSIKTKSA